MGRIKIKKIKKKKSPKNKDIGVRRGRKITKYYIILIIYNLGRLKNRLIKLVGAEVVA